MIIQLLRIAWNEKLMKIVLEIKYRVTAYQGFHDTVYIFYVIHVAKGIASVASNLSPGREQRARERERERAHSAWEDARNND